LGNPGRGPGTTKQLIEHALTRSLEAGGFRGGERWHPGGPGVAAFVWVARQHPADVVSLSVAPGRVLLDGCDLSGPGVAGPTSAPSLPSPARGGLVFQAGFAGQRTPDSPPFPPARGVGA
jgi:hypothetical protein